MGTTLEKSFKQARPIVSIDSPSVGLLVGLNVDYDTTPPTGLVTFPPSSIAIWDTGVWDSGIWGGGMYISKSWQSVQGFGYTGALHMKITSKTAQFAWIATDYLFQSGTGL